MNSRQQELYKLLESRADVVKISEIVEILEEEYPRHKERTKRANSRALRVLRDDVVQINLSTTPKAVISVKRRGKMVGYRLASKDELEKMAKKQYREAMRKLKIAHALRSKAEVYGCEELFEGTQWSNAMALFNIAELIDEGEHHGRA